MEGLRRVNKEAALLTFDMKGSTFNRYVMKDYPNIDPSTKVLKDKDFENLEESLFLENHVRD